MLNGVVWKIVVSIGCCTAQCEVITNNASCFYIYKTYSQLNCDGRSLGITHPSVRRLRVVCSRKVVERVRKSCREQIRLRLQSVIISNILNHYFNNADNLNCCQYNYRSGVHTLGILIVNGIHIFERFLTISPIVRNPLLSMSLSVPGRYAILGNVFVLANSATLTLSMGTFGCKNTWSTALVRICSNF